MAEQEPTHAPLRGVMLVPPEGPHPASLVDAYPDLTADEETALVTLSDGILTGGDSVMVMRVRHEGRPRALIVRMYEGAEGPLVQPIAMLLDADLFAGIEDGPPYEGTLDRPG